MTLYQKVIAVVGMLRSLIGKRAPKTEIAPVFDESRSYAPGRLVYYNDVLYRCVSDHSGSWDADHFSVTTIDDALSMKGDGGGSSSSSIDNLYARDPVTGLYHLLTVDTSDSIKTVLVNQSGQSFPRTDDAYAKGTDGKWYKLTIETVEGISTLKVNQEGVER